MPISCDDASSHRSQFQDPLYTYVVSNAHNIYVMHPPFPYMDTVVSFKKNVCIHYPLEKREGVFHRKSRSFYVHVHVLNRASSHNVYAYELTLLEEPCFGSKAPSSSADIMSLNHLRTIETPRQI